MQIELPDMPPQYEDAVTEIIKQAVRTNEMFGTIAGEIYALNHDEWGNEIEPDMEKKRELMKLNAERMQPIISYYRDILQKLTSFGYNLNCDPEMYVLHLKHKENIKDANLQYDMRCSAITFRRQYERGTIKDLDRYIIWVKAQNNNEQWKDIIDNEFKKVK